MGLWFKLSHHTKHRVSWQLQVIVLDRHIKWRVQICNYVFVCFRIDKKEVAKGARMILKAGQSVLLTLKATDSFGNAAEIDLSTPPRWTSSSPDVMTVLGLNTDLMKATGKSTGKVGTAQVSCVVDAKLGTEVKEIIGVIDFEVQGGEATTLTIEAGAPWTNPI
jgi:hypothetical protein